MMRELEAGKDQMHRLKKKKKAYDAVLMREVERQRGAVVLSFRLKVGRECRWKDLWMGREGGIGGGISRRIRPRIGKRE